MNSINHLKATNVKSGKNALILSISFVDEFYSANILYQEFELNRIK